MKKHLFTTKTIILVANLIKQGRVWRTLHNKRIHLRSFSSLWIGLGPNMRSTFWKNVGCWSVDFFGSPIKGSFSSMLGSFWEMALLKKIQKSAKWKMTLTEFKLTLPLILELSLEVSDKFSDRSLMAHQRSLMAHQRSPSRGAFSSILGAFWEMALLKKIQKSAKWKMTLAEFKPTLRPVLELFAVIFARFSLEGGGV